MSVSPLSLCLSNSQTSRNPLPLILPNTVVISISRDSLSLYLKDINPWWGYLTTSPFRCPLETNHPTSLPFSRGLKGLPIWGSVDSHRPIPPACPGTRGPGLYPDPLASLYVTTGSFCKMPGNPKAPGGRENGILDPPQRAFLQSWPVLPWQRSLHTCFLGTLRMPESAEDAPTKKLYSHSTQNAARCLRHDVATGRAPRRD